MASGVFPWWVSREEGGRAVLSVPPQPPRPVSAPEGSELSQGQLGLQPGSAASASRHGLPMSPLPGGSRASGQERGAVPDRAGSRFSNKRFILEGGNERAPDLLFQSPGLQRDRLS